jgi:hypothetical protein
VEIHNLEGGCREGRRAGRRDAHRQEDCCLGYPHGGSSSRWSAQGRVPPAGPLAVLPQAWGGGRPPAGTMSRMQEAAQDLGLRHSPCHAKWNRRETVNSDLKQPQGQFWQKRTCQFWSKTAPMAILSVHIQKHMKMINSKKLDMSIITVETVVLWAF